MLYSYIYAYITPYTLLITLMKLAENRSLIFLPYTHEAMDITMMVIISLTYQIIIL